MDRVNLPRLFPDRPVARVQLDPTKRKGWVAGAVRGGVPLAPPISNQALKRAVVPMPDTVS